MTERRVCINKIDVHAHAYRTDFPDKKLVYMPGPERLKQVYAQLGVSHAVLLPLVAPERRAFFCPTEHVMEIAKADPAAFSFSFALDPRMLHDGVKSDFTPLIEYYLSKGAVGVGEMQANIPFDSPLCDNLFSQLEHYGLPVTLHLSPAVGHEYGLVDGPGLPGLERALQMFPRLIFIGHSQSFWAHMSAEVTSESMKGYPQGKVTPGRVWDLLETYPNLFCDLSAGSGYNAITRDPAMGLRFLHRFHSRLMFGCDLCDPTGFPKLGAWLDQQYLDGLLAEDAYLNICRGTALRVFGRMCPAAGDQG